MTSRWAEVWEARRLDPTRGTTLAQLMAADGLDTQFGEVDEEDWRGFVLEVADLLGMQPGDSVFEVGCGAGAFLHVLAEAGYRVGGLDSSATLVGYARMALPNAEVVHAAADALDTGDTWDFVVSCGVFLYFPGLAYAARVLDRMAAKARRGVAVLDVLDIERAEEAIAARRRDMGAAEYEARYRELTHLAFERGWFVQTLAARGFPRADVRTQWLRGYGNARFRFNVVAGAARPELEMSSPESI